MRQIRISAAAAIVGFGALALVATPSFAARDQSATKAGAPVQLAHMGQGQGGAQTGQPCPMGMTGQDMMGRDMMGRDMMGPGMMGLGTAGQGMMAPGVGKGPGLSSQVVPSTDLSEDDVRHFFEHRLEMHGNKRLMVGEVKEADDDKIIADITTVDGSLVQRLEVDRHTGQMRDFE